MSRSLSIHPSINNDNYEYLISSVQLHLLCRYLNSDLNPVPYRKEDMLEGMLVSAFSIELLDHGLSSASVCIAVIVMRCPCCSCIIN